MAGYLLDTNVVSETRKPRPDDGITTFLAAADALRLYLSVLTIGELRKGIAAKRKTDPLGANALGSWVDEIETRFADRILPVDTAIARHWGELSATRPLPVVDTVIAATALRHGLTLVTRNTRDVAATGVAVVNPWGG